MRIAAGDASFVVPLSMHLDDDNPFRPFEPTGGNDVTIVPKALIEWFCKRDYSRPAPDGSDVLEN